MFLKIIQLMSKDEVRSYKLFSQRTNKDSDRKDIQLFDYIRRTGDDFSERKILKKLYGKVRQNTFNRLKNRLLTEISKSLTVQYFDQDDEGLIHHQIALAIRYRKRQQFDIAGFFLRKAELKALRSSHLEMLDLIYGEFIKLSLELPDINPEEYIQKREANRASLNKIRQMDNVLAAVNYRIRSSQNFSKNLPVIKLLEETVAEFAQDGQAVKNHSLSLRIYQAVSSILLQRGDYPALEDYLLTTWQQFHEEKIFSRSNHEIKLQMLTYLVNTFFKNGKLEQSLEYAALLKDTMAEYNRMLFDKYLFFYYNSLVLNYSQTDPEQAVSTLEQMAENPKIYQNKSYQVYIHLNMSVLEFDLGKYRASVKNLVKLQILEDFQSRDESFRLSVGIFELIVRFELEDFDSLEYRMKQIRSDFRHLLEEATYAKEQEMIGLLARMMTLPAPAKDEKIRARMRGIIEAFPDGESADKEVIRMNDWLRDKLEG